MENIVTTQLYLVPFKLEIVKAAIIGNAELEKVLAVTVLPNWCEEEFLQNLPGIPEIFCKDPLQGEWGWGSLIIQKAENTLIGHTMVKIIPDSTGSPTGSLEIGYFIVPSYRQQGYASEAAKATIEWAFCQPNVQKVTAGCDPDNIASKRVLEKIGMQLIESREKVLVWELCKTATI
ncbi:MAG: GNAT family N-acetyltransferase [Brasilonema angustatum HA4187-MV1]|jgi:RimJ/RimL family protein N-acetyltransferase|nr:GNAT family N-acetyltransferase [Brasilonema angustatum HA4187-MV1]